MSDAYSASSLKEAMIVDCAASYMAKIENKDECVRHLAFQALPQTSVSEISKACERMNDVFTVKDARELCMGLNDVHASFWPRFMRN